MSDTFTVRSERVLVDGRLVPASIVVSGERIAAIESHGFADGPLTDLGDLVILPGLVDCHVHMNEPGRTEWEGFESGTLSAAAGGVTTVADMPLNSSPVTIDVEALAAKRTAGAGKLSVDCCLHGGLVSGSAGNIPALIDAGACGIKAFLVHSGIDEFPSASREDVEEALSLLEGTGVPLLVHAELDPAGESDIGRTYSSYLASRPDAMETRAIGMLIEAARKRGSRLHVVHLASAEALPLIEAAKAGGLPLTVETAPHYLTFAAEEIPDGATQFKCAPPIRSAATREALWRALESGLIDMIATDHSPCPPGMKDPEGGDFSKAWGGISSLQLLLSATWSGARRRGIALERLAGWLSLAPARLLGVDDRKGSISAGKDADLVAFDPEESWTVRPEALFHRHRVTPYAGMELRGLTRRTYLRGREIYRDGRMLAAGHGRFLERRKDARHR